MLRRKTMTSLKKTHSQIIDEVLKYINLESDQFILKGGTALYKCYGLDRFSEDIDLDALSNQNIFNIIEQYCHKKKYPFNIQKNTGTVKRITIKYVETLDKDIEKDFETHGLKIETSYRRKGFIPSDILTTVNGIKTYKISELFKQKIGAYNNRYKLRDLYDICYIYLNFKDKLTADNILSLIDAFSYKGLGEVDALLFQDSDPLIDNDKLGNEVLNVYDSLGLLEDKPTSLKERLEERIKVRENKEKNKTLKNTNDLSR